MSKVNLKDGKLAKTFFYKGRQIYIVHMVTNKYEGYHFKIVNRCNSDAGECYSVPFKYESECEQVSVQMIKQGKI